MKPISNFRIEFESIIYYTIANAEDKSNFSFEGRNLGKAKSDPSIRQPV